MVFIRMEVNSPWLTGRGSKKPIQDALRATWLHLGKTWKSRFAMKHFTNDATQEYGYAYRSGERIGTRGRMFWASYTGRKWKRKGHALPLVWTGTSRSDVAQSNDFVATFRGVTIKLHAPRLNYRNRHMAPGLDMRKEMKRISESEAKALTEEAARVLRVEVDRAAYTKVVKDLYR